MVGIYAGVKSSGEGRGWWWFGSQGLEYLQLGRALQIALFVGLLVWAALLVRAFWPTLRRQHRRGSLEGLLLASGAGIAIVYAFGMIPLTEPLESATMADYWRWWVVPLWVEGMFEFFTATVIAYAVLSLGLLSRRFVERIVLLELRARPVPHPRPRPRRDVRHLRVARDRADVPGAARPAADCCWRTS